MALGLTGHRGDALAKPQCPVMQLQCEFPEQRVVLRTVQCTQLSSICDGRSLWQGFQSLEPLVICFHTHFKGSTLFWRILVATSRPRCGHLVLTFYFFFPSSLFIPSSFSPPWL